MARQDFWTMPMDELAQIVGKSGLPDSDNEATSKAAGRVWATWALVAMTLVVAVVTAV